MNSKAVRILLLILSTKPRGVKGCQEQQRQSCSKFFPFSVMCAATAEDPKSVFEIKIEREEPVDFLVDSIEDEGVVVLLDCDASHLILWNVSVLFDDNLERNVEGLDLCFLE
jgi:hypothetical protein